MKTADIIRTLDAIECEMRHLEYRIHGIRAALRNQIDPLHQRKDLGFFDGEKRRDVATDSPNSNG
jgi:hypothetical protein